MDSARRGLAARIGVTALNLLLPGLGLIRLGRTSAGLSWALLPFALVALPIVVLLIDPMPEPMPFLAIMALLVIGVVGAYLGSIWTTWRRSKLRHADLRWWSKWYALLAVYLVMQTGWLIVVPYFLTFEHSFYIPSESNLPTFAVNDRIFASMRAGRSPVPGQIILIRAVGQIRVYRVVARGGQRVGVRGGIPVVDGVMARQFEDGILALREVDYPAPVHRRVEQLPGERGTHLVLDAGAGEGDDMPETLVPPGHIFVLGDNRDRAADSRFPTEQMGVGMVPETDIVGAPIVFYWAADRSKIGIAPR